jgi:predicted O-methyltransferase YrrM
MPKIGSIKRCVAFTAQLLEPKGQITSKDSLGRWITHLSSLPEVKYIVEIGTWNGRGSSACIIRGVRSRAADSIRGVQCLGLEVDKKMHARASRYLSRSPWFAVVNGSIVDENQLDRSDLSGTEIEWLAEDVRRIREAEYMASRIFPKIDLLILDGGEFSTYAEFKLLEGRLTRGGWLILDDTKTRKCSRVLTEVKSNPGFSLVYESDERNGVAVARVNGPVK